MKIQTALVRFDTIFHFDSQIQDVFSLLPTLLERTALHSRTIIPSTRGKKECPKKKNEEEKQDEVSETLNSMKEVKSPSCPLRSEAPL